MTEDATESPSEGDEFIEVEGLSEDLDDLTNIDREQLASVSVSGADWTVGTIYQQIRKGNILLDPYFQRRDAWSTARKSQYIESLLLGIPVPQIVLGEVPGTRGKFVVIDGKQRLLTIVQFYASTDPFDDRYRVLRLRDLPILRALNGKTKKKIEGDLELANYIDGFENQDIRTNIVRHVKTDDILYQIFLRLNTGSVKLSPQELRRALSPGEFWVHVDEVTEKSPALAFIFHGRIPDFRMRDVELLLRYIAFQKFLPQYDGNMKRFLDRVASYFAREWDIRAGEFTAINAAFERAVGTTVAVFGDDAFKKFKGGAYEFRFNRAVFDTMSYYFSNPEIANAAVERIATVRKSFEELCANDDGFVSAIETTTKSLGATRYRLHAWGGALSAALDRDIAKPVIGS